MNQLNFVKAELQRKGSVYHTYGYTLSKIDKGFKVVNEYNKDDVIIFKSLKAAYSFIVEC